MEVAIVANNNSSVGSEASLYIVMKADAPQIAIMQTLTQGYFMILQYHTEAKTQPRQALKLKLRRVKAEGEGLEPSRDCSRTLSKRVP